MGLLEQIRAGATLDRSSTTFPVSATGEVTLESAYVILSVSTDKPCRLRLYDTPDGLTDIEEINRLFGNTNISSSISLVGDFYMDGTSRQSVDPVLYAVASNADAPVTYYRADSLTDEIFPDDAAIRANITLTKFSIEDNRIAPLPGTTYSVSNRRTLIFAEPDVDPSSKIQGVVSTTPKTFLLVSASLDAGEFARLRIYGIEDDIYQSNELNRAFDQAAATTTSLISDIILSGSNSTLYFTPKTIGANLNTMGSDLAVTRRRRFTTDNTPAISGTSEIYYIIENLNNTTDTISISLHVYSLED
jgi:hypothetical protein